VEADIRFLRIYFRSTPRGTEEQMDGCWGAQRRLYLRRRVSRFLGGPNVNLPCVYETSSEAFARPAGRGWLSFEGLAGQCRWGAVSRKDEGAVRPVRFERTTFGFEVRRSIPLSYGRRAPPLPRDCESTQPVNGSEAEPRHGTWGPCGTADE
jgi:hypothetical protein